VRRIRYPILSAAIALAAVGTLHAQDNGGVRVAPPYTPGNENQPSIAPPMHVPVDSVPRELWIRPQMIGSRAVDGAPGLYFRASDLVPGTVHYGIRVRVSETFDEDDSSKYYETPDVHVRGRADGFNLWGTFERSYRRDRRRDPPFLPPQDETERRPPLELTTPGVPAVPWITGGGPAGKVFLSLELDLKGLDADGLRVDEVSNDGIVPGGGVQLSMWGGIVRAGLSYLQGDIRTNRFTTCHETLPIPGPYIPPGGDDVVLVPLDPSEEPPIGVDPGPVQTCEVRRLNGRISIWEIDLMLTVLEGTIDLGGGFQLYSQCGPIATVEYVQVEIGGQRADGWAISGGAFVEGGVRSGRLRFFTRASAAWGFGLGEIDGSSGLTLFGGVELEF
jgi:hypothetical protein